MPSTYMELTNRLLRRLNEVEISESDFASVRGIQATAKDCILDVVREINTTKIDWPFNAVEHTQNLLVGVEEYAWPIDFTAADWNSFQIQQDDALDVKHRSLTLISREQWYKDGLRDHDYNTGSDGQAEPRYCFPSHGQGWGVSPSPAQVYTLKYRYYKNPTDLDAFDDEVTIPTKFDYVITAGGLYHMNLFKENPDGVALMEKKYKSGIDNMINVLLPNAPYVYGPNMNPGGGQKSYYHGMWTGY